MYFRFVIRRHPLSPYRGQVEKSSTEWFFFSEDFFFEYLQEHSSFLQGLSSGIFISLNSLPITAASFFRKCLSVFMNEGNNNKM